MSYPKLYVGVVHLKLIFSFFVEFLIFDLSTQSEALEISCDLLNSHSCKYLWYFHHTQYFTSVLETGTLTGKSSSDRLAWLGACYHVARSHGLSCESPRIHLSPPPQLWGYTWQLVHPGFLYGFWGLELRALYYIERTLQIKPFPQPLRVSFSLIKNVYHSHFIEKECGTEAANRFPQITQRFVVSTGSQEAAPPLPSDCVAV